MIPKNIEQIRQSFPALHQRVYGDRPLVYLDNAATTLKPQIVLDSLVHHYSLESANIHRGLHYMSEQATAKFEETREKVQRFINAASGTEIIFTKGTTESINLVASSYVRHFLQPGDEILISWMEHHSNIVPWQMAGGNQNLSLKVVPINDEGEIILNDLERMLSPKTKLVSLVYVSNSLGTINPLKEIIPLIRKKSPEARILIDAAQAVAHLPINVQELDCDFMAFSGHKLFGPTGVGVLYGKKDLLEKMPPYQGGGDMIESVTFERTSYNSLPYKFEAGTPPIAGVIGLGQAIDFVNELGLSWIMEREKELLDYGTKILTSIPDLRIIGTAKNKSSILSFVMEGIHPHDIGTFADQEGIALRTGHHCTQPVMQRFKIPATSRASLAFYNTHEEIDQLRAALIRIKEIFA